MKQLEETINDLYQNNGRKIHQMCDKRLRRFGGLAQKDYDDFYSAANEACTMAMGTYEGNKDSFEGYLYRTIQFAIIEEIQNQIETVIHEGYDMKQISKLVRLYNNHKSMNTAQKAFTYIDNFARKTREILSRQFFIECTGYSNTKRKSGTMERVVMETMMCIFHMNSWKKNGKQTGEYLNEYSSIEESEVLNQEICQLEKIMTDDLYSVFTAKDSFIWFTLFDDIVNIPLHFFFTKLLSCLPQ